MVESEVWCTEEDESPSERADSSPPKKVPVLLAGGAVDSPMWEPEREADSSPPKKVLGLLAGEAVD